ncbi:MAG: dockerin type I domain-containing protein [Candidatus Poribacteria bacterium]|nr:dockerin type I domain-containing protein [Candidatus Poribacteria bacterium]MDE0505865.1 dockerin type I domain-containing protein [Candidatus Poribacteria bacterium]
MKTTLASLILLSLVSLNTTAQNTSRWGLPEGAKVRLGRGVILGLQYSPEGTRLAVTGGAGVWLYDSATGDPVSLMRRGNIYYPRRVTFNPDGVTLTIMTGDIQIWDAATGEPRRTVPAEFGSVWRDALSADGLTIATSEADVVRVWDADTGELRHTLIPEHEEGFGNVISLAVSPDGRTVASSHTSLAVGHSARDGIIRLWDAATGELQTSFSDGIRNPLRLAFSPDGRTLAVGHGDWAFGAGTWGWVSLRNAATGALKHELQGHAGAVYSLAYSADGRTFASGSVIDSWRRTRGTTVRIWDAATGALLRTLEDYVWEVGHLALSPDGGTLAVASRDGRLSLWDTAAGIPILHVEGHSGPISRIAFSPDRRTVAAANRVAGLGSVGAGTVRLWDAVTGGYIFALEGHRDRITSVAFNPAGRTLASGSRDGTVRVWDAATRETISTLTGHTGGVNSVAFSPDGGTLASVGDKYDRNVNLWNTGTGLYRRSLFGSDADIIGVAFSPDGGTVAGATTRQILLWDVEKRTPKRTLTVTTEDLSPDNIAFSPDGDLLAAVAPDAIHLWDASTGEQISSLHGYHARNTSVAFSPVDDTLASGNTDNRVRLWDSAAGENIRTFEGHIGDVTSVAFSPDGSTLASGSGDGTVLLWEIFPSPDPPEDEQPQVAEPPQVKPDVNGDGVVDILDLVLVAGRLGTSGENREDVNGDGTVNILDLVLVAGMMDNAAGAPLSDSGGPEMLRTTQVRKWLEEARQIDLADPAIPRGIEYLENLLEALTPERTKLLPNYPNPFNPETWIPYQLARDAVVRISIYNAKGILVRHVDLGLQAEGYYTDKHHAAYWDGRNESGELLANGVYICVFRAESYRASRRMAIVR